MQTIETYDFAGKKALIRVDFNVPLDENFVHLARLAKKDLAQHAQTGDADEDSDVKRKISRLRPVPRPAKTQADAVVHDQSAQYQQKQGNCDLCSPHRDA